MDAKGIYQKLQEVADGALSDFQPEAKDPFCRVEPDRLVEVALAARKTPDLEFDFLECLSGMDDKENLWVVYHLFSYKHRHTFVLKVKLDRDEPVVASLEEVWKSANWMEREVYDLYGVRFAGHPDLRRILLPDDWVGHPLRKDYREESHYHGIETTRPDTLELYGLWDTRRKQ